MTTEFSNYFQGPGVEALVEAQVNIGRLEAEVAHLTKTVEELKAGNIKMAATLVDIQRTLSEARGGWRTLMWVGGAAATAGSLITWFLAHMSWRT